MHYTIEMLVNGNSEILEFYRKAKHRWKKILNENQNANSNELSKVLTNEQLWFEYNCGTRWIGQEIMVVTGITQFYSTDSGFDERKDQALLVYNAFMNSYCSIEVKGAANSVAKNYYLIEG